jgi:catechol 2,3-dioxygenase-like lactoylglutathione lyase family enzyme
LPRRRKRGSTGARYDRSTRKESRMAASGIFYVFVFVSDFERSKKFYAQTLGWKLGTDEKDVAGFAFGSGYLVIHGDDRPPPQRRYAGGMQVEVKVDDVEREHTRLKELGVAVGDLHEQPWGERNFYFEDPDGYVWSYGQPLG